MAASMQERTDVFRWQGGTARDSRLVLGEIADGYDDIRPGYQPDLVDRVVSWARPRLSSAVEIGAGTGKATLAFAPLGLAITCLEPDAEMADVLRAKVLGFPKVSVEQTRFEQWVPPRGGVDLIYCAQAWHWVDPAARCMRAWDLLAPRGVLAIFGHRYLFADPTVERAMDEVYSRWAPQLVDDPATRAVPPDQYWYGTELINCGLFADVQAEGFDTVVRYPTDRYIELLDTFSSHRLLPASQREQLREAAKQELASRSSYVDVQLGTVLVLARRKAEGRRSPLGFLTERLRRGVRTDTADAGQSR